MTIKRYLLALSAILLIIAARPHIAAAQASLAVVDLSIHPQTVNFNEEIIFRGCIKNTGTVAFTGIITVKEKADSLLRISLVLNVAATTPLNPGDSICFTWKELADPLHYRAGGNIVVVWPDAYLVDTDSNSAQFFINQSKRGVNPVTYASGTNELKVQLYPNPSNGLVALHWSKDVELTNTTVFNLMGKKVYEVSGDVKELDLGSLQAGTYIVELNTSTGDVIKTRIIRN